MTFWKDIDKVVKRLNVTNRQVIVRNPSESIVTNYLLWAILKELQLNNKLLTNKE